MNPTKLNSVRGVLLAFSAVCVFGGPVSAFAQSRADADVRLSLHKVARASDGKESLVDAKSAGPGDPLEYRAVYSNRTGATQRDVRLTLPVPEGMRFVAGTDQPTAAWASLDGKTFAPIPLKRKVKSADGREIEAIVPSTEYRALRWQNAAVAAGQTAAVTARMQLLANGN
jgi:uncharacterized repeat protein (TIGR01451 family)